MEPLVKTREKICDYIGENRNDFQALIKERGLPAWKSKPNGLWKALRVSLDTWLKQQEEEHLKNTCQ